MVSSRRCSGPPVASGRSDVVGDVTFLHDVSALTDGLGPTRARPSWSSSTTPGAASSTSSLPATQLDEATFEEFFSTQRDHDLVAIARSFSTSRSSCTTRAELLAHCREGLERDGVTVVVARVPSRRENVRRHDAATASVAERLDEAGWRR
jgi:2-succinyl-5-enolpyruvyl-6-hydroxy-3-cyclohexene-1-carboxylate synthase